MADTLLLDNQTWDLVIDAHGDIAVASDPYAMAQDAASAIKLFQGEYYYDTTIGVPYWTQILAFTPPLNYMKAKFTEAALTVEGVEKAVCFITSVVRRKVSGQVQVTDQQGNTQAASF